MNVAWLIHVLAQAKSQDLLGNKDYKETAWVVDEAELMHGGTGSIPAAPLQPTEYKNCSRMNSCSGSGMGLKVRSRAR